MTKILLIRRLDINFTIRQTIGSPTSYPNCTHIKGSQPNFLTVQTRAMQYCADAFWLLYMLRSWHDILSPTSQQHMKWGLVSLIVSCAFSILPQGYPGSSMQLYLKNIQHSKIVRKKNVKPFGSWVSCEAPSKFWVWTATLYSCKQLPGSAIDCCNT